MNRRNNKHWAWADTRDVFFKQLIDENLNFIEEVLEGHPEIKDKQNWPSAIADIESKLSAKFAFCRSIIADYDVIQWINPAAVVVPRPPEHFTGNKVATWGETLSFATWLPTHRMEQKQGPLLLAYFAVNFTKNVNDQHHLSACIHSKIENGYDKGCFVANLDNNGKVTVHCCCANGKFPSCEVITSFPGEHYKELFALNSSTEILFLPNRALSRISTSDSMYSSHMVGCYLGVARGACNHGYHLPEDLKALCDYFSELMYITARDKANRQLYRALTEQSQSLDKYRQMFDLLTTPLRSLTEALAQTQTETQELRAILYEPMDAIFECQPLIEELFDDSKNISGTDIRPKHQIENYSDKDIDVMKNILALALSRFKGDNSTNLKEEICFYKNVASRVDHAFHQLSLLLPRVIGFSKWDCFLKRIDDPSYLRKLLENLKGRLFTVYKPSEVTKALQWTWLKSFLPDISEVEITLLNLTDTIPPLKLTEQNAYVVTQRANPLCTHGHLIQFLSGVITANMKKGDTLNAELILDECPIKKDNVLYTETIKAENARKIECIFILDKSLDKSWIKDEGISDLTKMVNKELIAKREKIRQIGGYGDFHRPFANFIRRLSDDYINVTKIERIEPKKNSVKIVVGNNFEVNFEDNKFCLISNMP